MIDSFENAPELIRVEDLHKSSAPQRLKRHYRNHPQGRSSPDRPVRLRQIDLPALPQPARGTDQRPHLV